MRYLSLLALAALSLIVFPQQSFAAGGTSSHADSVCVQDMKCPEEPDEIQAVFPRATACAARFFGFSTKTELFDTSRGLGIGNCLVPASSQTFGSSTTPLSPHCCISRDTYTGRCSMMCGVVVAKK